MLNSFSNNIILFTSRISMPYHKASYRNEAVTYGRSRPQGHKWNNNPIMDKIKVLVKETRDPHGKVLEAVHFKLKERLHSTTIMMDILMPQLYLVLLREDMGGGHATDHRTASALKP